MVAGLISPCQTRKKTKTEGPISFELNQVRLVDARIDVDRDISRPNALVEARPILLTGVDAEIAFLSPNEQDLQEVLFEAAGQLDGGEFEAQGEAILEERVYNVALQTHRPARCRGESVSCHRSQASLPVPLKQQPDGRNSPAG